MQRKKDKYAQISDSEWIDILMATPKDDDAHEYFFYQKCGAFLTYISLTIFDSNSIYAIVGSFYQFLSYNDWQVLRNYKGRNGATLCSYLSRSAINHFIDLKRREDAIIKVDIDQPTILQELSQFTVEEREEMPPVWEAYENLCERDRTILRLLVIEEKSALEAADAIWPYVKSKNKDWRSLPTKRVQDTISMLKKRAVLALSLELNKHHKGNFYQIDM